MKKIIPVILFIMLFTSTSFATQLPKGVKDSNTLQIYMRQKFYYGHDKIPDEHFEYFQIPSVLEFSRVGDCDDFAIYSYYYLHKMNYKTSMYVIILKIKDKIIGHAVTAFLDTDKTYSIFSNKYILKTSQSSSIEAVKDIYPTWQIVFIWKPIKFGFLTVKEVYDSMYPVEFKDLKAEIMYLIDKYKIGIERCQ